MRTSSAKAKGRRLAQKCSDLILSRLPIKKEDVTVTPSGVPGPDLTFGSSANGVWPFDDIEIKNQETVSIWAWLKQMEKRGDKGLLVFSRNRAPIYAALSFELLLELTKGYAFYLANHSSDQPSQQEGPSSYPSPEQSHESPERDL